MPLLVCFGQICHSHYIICPYVTRFSIYGFAVTNLLPREAEFQLVGSEIHRSNMQQLAKVKNILEKLTKASPITSILAHLSQCPTNSLALCPLLAFQTLSTYMMEFRQKTLRFSAMILELNVHSGICPTQEDSKGCTKTTWGDREVQVHFQ